MASLHVDRHLPHTATTSEVDRLMKSLSAATDSPETLRDRAMFQLLYATGLRAGEMVALNVGDIDASTGIITVATGRGKMRQIVINSRLAVEAVQDYLMRGRPHLVRAGANLAAEHG